MHRLTAAALLAFALAAPAFAQTSPGIQPGSPETKQNVQRNEHNACFHDVNRYCSDAVGDDMKVLACLQDHRKRLSKGCNKLLEEHGQ
jgi:hypothetical protein